MISAMVEKAAITATAGTMTQLTGLKVRNSLKEA